jgi:hypothetical protein
MLPFYNAGTIAGTDTVFDSTRGGLVRKNAAGMLILLILNAILRRGDACLWMYKEGL